VRAFRVGQRESLCHKRHDLSLLKKAEERGQVVSKPSRGGLVLFRGSSPMDALIPQGDDAFLLRNYWSEMRLVSDAGTGTPRLTLRPLWFKADPVALDRVATGTSAK